MAEDVYERALEGYTTELGSRHPTTIAVAGGLGALYVDMGEPAKAERAHWRAAAASETALGKTHPLTLDSQLNLAVLLAGLKKRSKAVELLQQVLARSEVALGPYHAITCDALFQLGQLHQGTGQFGRSHGDAAARARRLRDVAWRQRGEDDEGSRSASESALIRNKLKARLSRH